MESYQLNKEVEREGKEIVKYEYLDSLRGLAILAVVITHVGQIINGMPDYFLKITSTGRLGVHLFFIVSSLTLFLSYKQRKLVDGSNIKLFFYLRRFFRIAPSFYLAILSYSFLQLVANYILTGSFGTLNFLYILLFSSFLGVFYTPVMFYLPFGGWTVAIEMFYYLFVPFLYNKINSLKKSIILFIALLLVYMVTLVIFNISGAENNLILNFLIFPEQLPVFALGIICYFIISLKLLNAKYSNLVMLFSLSYILFFIFNLSNLDYLGYVPYGIIISIGFVGLVLSMSTKKYWLLQNKITAYLGKISYSIYLWHFSFTWLFRYLYKKYDIANKYGPYESFFFILTATLILIIPISIFAQKYVETYGISIGKKIINKIKNAQ